MVWLLFLKHQAVIFDVSDSQHQHLISMSDKFTSEEELEKSSSRRHHREHKEKFEEEVKAFTEDPEKLAREILSLKRELNRLHYKMKSYQESNRSLMLIFNILIMVMLMGIAYRVFSLR